MEYIISPYNHPDSRVVAERISLTSKFVAAMIERGFTPVSPSLYGHGLIIEADMVSHWLFWEKFCKSLLEKCNSVIVLQLEGWDRSIGVKAELEHVAMLGLPVRYTTPAEFGIF
jgi:hypothetical protein